MEILPLHVNDVRVLKIYESIDCLVVNNQLLGSDSSETFSYHDEQSSRYRPRLLPAPCLYFLRANQHRFSPTLCREAD